MYNDLFMHIKLYSNSAIFLHLFGVAGIENILTDARSSPSETNMTTTQSAHLASGLLTVSQVFLVIVKIILAVPLVI